VAGVQTLVQELTSARAEIVSLIAYQQGKAAALIRLIAAPQQQDVH
jgi:hypothetical protein